LVYGRVVAEHIDPIEKKPLYHVLPGSRSYSIATLGCNFRCLHCQNASLSQVADGSDVARSGVFRRPADIIRAAIAGGCQSVSYTYVEPTIFFEFAYDCCVLAAEAGLKNIFVSNGYMSARALKNLAPVLTAINIDLKAFTDTFYRKICGARLAPVLDTIALCRALGIFVEVTTLIIPGLNDREQELGEIAKFLVSIDPSMPWHVSGYHPAYKMSMPPPTGTKILLRARQLGVQQGLQFVYLGNRIGTGGEDTSCPNCDQLLISRQGFHVIENRLRDGHCPSCRAAIAGIWG
jgi:pyruvate formate lyase activating enzyme